MANGPENYSITRNMQLVPFLKFEMMRKLNRTHQLSKFPYTWFPHNTG